MSEEKIDRIVKLAEEFVNSGKAKIALAEAIENALIETKRMDDAQVSVQEVRKLVDRLEFIGENNEED
jgi:hypothetical protein